MESVLVGASEPLEAEGEVAFPSAVTLTAESLVKKLTGLQR